MQLADNRSLITGGAGLIGSHIADLLAEKGAAEIVVLDNFVRGRVENLAAAMVSIVFMRWGVWGGIHAALAGAVYCIAGGGTAPQFAVYILGNLFSLLAVPALRRVGAE